MKNWWVSWWCTGSFTLDSPWWISGERYEGEVSICAAIKAENWNDAKWIVKNAQDDQSLELEWRFIEERPSNWSPFSDRFQKADWMTW